jgi:hypothetical protein
MLFSSASPRELSSSDMGVGWSSKLKYVRFFERTFDFSNINLIFRTMLHVRRLHDVPSHPPPKGQFPEGSKNHGVQPF